MQRHDFDEQKEILIRPKITKTLRCAQKQHNGKTAYMRAKVAQQ